MVTKKKSPLGLDKRQKLYQSVLENYQIMNLEYCRGLGVFVFDVVEVDKEKNDVLADIRRDNDIANMVTHLLAGKARPTVFKKSHYPIKAGQMAVLYKLDPLRYDGFLTTEFMDFLGTHFHGRYVYIVCRQGFLSYVVLMNSTKQERSMIQQYFLDNLEQLPKFQFLTSEVNPKVDEYRLLAQIQDHKKNAKLDIRDIILQYF